MRYQSFSGHKIDTVIGARLFNLGWLSTGLGIAVLQMRLLALAWQQSHLASLTACIAGCWLLGSLLAGRLDTRSVRATRLLGMGFVACVVLWLLMPLPPAVPEPSLNAVIGMSELAVAAYLLGMLSGAWLAQRRPWPPLAEWSVLGKGLSGAVVGLCVVWLLPAWAGLIGLCCIMPLLIIDCWPLSQCPLPAPGNVLDSWYDIYGETGRLPRLKRSELPRGWLWNYLVQRNRLFLTSLGSAAAVLIGAIWAAVPTPFAAELGATHRTGVLIWLVTGQEVALLGGMICFYALRDVLGPPDRLIPARWHSWARSAAFCTLAGSAISLIALGWPSLQSAWSLAGSIAIYTFTAAAWGILLPRLKPAMRTLMLVQRHMLPRQTRPLLNRQQMAYEQAQEEYAKRVLTTVEALLTVLIAPCIGWYVDHASVDIVLVNAGLFMLACFVLAMLGFGLMKVLRGRRRARKLAPIIPTISGQAYQRWQEPA